MASVALHPRVRALGAAGLGVLCVSQFVDVLSVNTAVIALPDIRGDLGIGPSGAQWVISSWPRGAATAPATASRTLG